MPVSTQPVAELLARQTREVGAVYDTFLSRVADPHRWWEGTPIDPYPILQQLAHASR